MRRSRRSPNPAPASPVTVLMPGASAGEWVLLRRSAARASAIGPVEADEALAPAVGTTTRQTFVSLEAAAVNLLPEEGFNLDIPLDFGLVQRFVLPSAEPDELEEMARIQLEKILPYPIDDVGIALQTIRRTESEAVLAVQAAHHERLLNLCQPLTAHGRWPLRVNFHALAITTGAIPGENTAFLYREAGKIVVGICEEGRLSFAQALSGETAEELAGELPAVFLGAELEGVPTAFQFVRLDDRCADFQAVIQAALGVPVEIFRAEPEPEIAAPLNSPLAKDLSPASWLVERQRVLRRVRLKRNILLGAGIYLGLLLVAFLFVGVMRFQVHRLDARLLSASPQVDKIKAAETRWKALAPAIDPSRSVDETFRQVWECLPPGDAVRLTLYDQKLDSIEIRGEATSQTALAFTEKIKNRPELREYRFQTSPPAVLPNGHAQFSITGTHN